ncbi:MAG: DUF3429 domain-containing protein [Candidatus Jidaibacter sp.]|jgi:hypothetical protein|nr:DUF3429 domain-containing protein [Candidatus Jidaibacter sp.]
MKEYDINLAKLLTYSGTLPFIGCALVTALQLNAIDAAFVAHAYSVVIISFLCGIHWAIYLFFSEKCLNNLLLSSNIIALIAWISLIASANKISLLFQPLCFLYLLMLDRKLRDVGVLATWFYDLRRNATIIVIVSLIIVMGLS